MRREVTEGTRKKACPTWTRDSGLRLTLISALRSVTGMQGHPPWGRENEGPPLGSQPGWGEPPDWRALPDLLYESCYQGIELLGSSGFDARFHIAENHSAITRRARRVMAEWFSAM